jgi:hypothetical protein
MRKLILLTVTAILTVSSSASVLAQMPAPPPMSASEEIVARMNQLEAETQALRAEVQWMREHPVRLPEVSATPVGMESAPAAIPDPAPTNHATMEQVQSEAKKYSWKKGDFTITPYGWLWSNMVNNSERTNPGSYTLYVLSASTGPESEFIVDARNTRLGFDVGGPQIPFFNCAKSGGKVEIDFQQTVLSTENKPSILLRHAYAEVKDDDFRLVAGQTWDVISPLFPGMLMYSVGWDGGNIGYRRAQFRGERYFHCSDVSLVTTQLSVNQNIFADATTTIRGEPSNWPILEGRVAWTIGHRAPGDLPITIGLSGHIGEEEFEHAVLGVDDRRRTWSGNIDVRVPLTDRLGVQGEVYVGENLDSFLGGIGQGLNPITLDTIRDSGGWVEIWYDWTPRLHSHVGYSVDDPNNHDLTVASERSYNQFYFGNLSYDLTKNFFVGVEVSSWKTLYVGQLPGDSVRCEFVAKYGF